MRTCFYLICLSAYLSVASVANAIDYTIKSDGTGNYSSLELLRQAIGVPAIGDTITLYNNDSTISPTVGDTGLSLAVSGTSGTLLIGSDDASQQRIIGSGRTGTNTGRFLTLTGGAATGLTLELKI